MGLVCCCCLFFFSPNTKMPKWGQLKKLKTTAQYINLLACQLNFVNISSKMNMHYFHTAHGHCPQQWPTKHTGPKPQARKQITVPVCIYHWYPGRWIKRKQPHRSAKKGGKKPETNHEGKNNSDLCNKPATTQPHVGSPGFCFHVLNFSTLLLLSATSASHLVPAGSH